MNYFVKYLRVLLNVIKRIEITICLIGVWLTTILVFCAIINRYFLRFPIMWINDFALYCFIFFMLFAVALTTRERQHTSVDIFRQKVFSGKPKANAIYDIFLDIVSIFIVIIFIPLANKFMLQAIKYPEYGTLLRWFNTSWLRMAVFFSFILILIHLITLLLEDFGKLRTINATDGGN